MVYSGDSYSRTGFHYNLTGLNSKKNPSTKNPLGNPSWPGKTSTGGANWVGYFGTKFNSTLTLLWNYASSGCVIDRAVVPPRLPKYLTFVDQVGFFNASIANRPEYAPWTPENSAVGIWFGINELGRTKYFPARNLTEVIPRMIESLGAQAQILHGIGLRNFAFLEIPPLGLVPGVRVLRDLDELKTGLYVSTFNYHLRKMVKSFDETNSDTKVSLIPVEDIFWDAVMRPEVYGAANSTCWSRQGRDCLWWDGFHPAQAIHSAIAHRVAEA
ncbi:hypothetical protein B0T10DRAFT_593305, partial [Thelonectria olida]